MISQESLDLNTKEYRKVQERRDNHILKKYKIESFTNPNLIYQILEYEDGAFQCSCPDHVHRHRECKHIRRIKYPPIEYKINEHLKLIFEDGKSKIFVNGVEFTQCKYLLIINPHLKEQQDQIDSIDEAKELLSNGLERNITTSDLGITPEQEFWGHCSNLEAWYLHDYDTRLLHSNLSFPLLKKLAKSGDQLAKRVFKDEVLKRVESGYMPVIIFLIEEGYISREFFTKEELYDLYELIKNLDEYLFKTLRQQAYL